MSEKINAKVDEKVNEKLGKKINNKPNQVAGNFFKICKNNAHIYIKVTTKSSQNKVRGVRACALLIDVTAAPENGKANSAVIEILSTFLKISKSEFVIIRGKKSQNKVVLLEGEKFFMAIKDIGLEVIETDC